MKFIKLTQFDSLHLVIVNLACVQSIWQRVENGEAGTMLRMADGDAIFVKESIKTLTSLMDAGKIDSISL